MNNEKQKHSPEPWHWDGKIWDYNPSEEAPWILDAKGGNVLIGEITGSKENAERIVTCVNTLAGIEDPESYLKQLKEEREQLIEALEESNKILTLCTKERQSIGLFNDTMLTISENEELLTKLKGEQL